MCVGFCLSIKLRNCYSCKKKLVAAACGPFARDVPPPWRGGWGHAHLAAIAAIANWLRQYATGIIGPWAKSQGKPRRRGDTKTVLDLDSGSGIQSRERKSGWGRGSSVCLCVCLCVCASAIAIQIFAAANAISIGFHFGWLSLPSVPANCSFLLLRNRLSLSLPLSLGLFRSRAICLFRSSNSQSAYVSVSLRHLLYRKDLFTPRLLFCSFFAVVILFIRFFRSQVWEPWVDAL